MGDPNSWLVYFMENPIKIDDLEVPPFQETLIYIYIVRSFPCLQRSMDDTHKS